MITISPLLNFLSTPVLSLSLGIVLILLIFVAMPLKKLKAYTQDGVTIYFSPVLGFFRYMQQNLTKKGDQLAGFKEASKTHSNPKFLATHISRRPFLVLQDPQYIKEFLQKQNNYVKTHISDVFKPLIGNGLVTAEGEIWKRHRKIVSASFNFEFLKTNMPVVQKTTQEFLNKLTADDYKDYSVISRIQEITGEIVGRIFFGENLNNYTFEGKSLTLALADITGQIGMSAKEPLVVLFGAKVMKVPFLPRYRKLMQRINGFRKVCFKIINDRKSKSHTNSDDLLSSLLATQASPDIEKRFSDEDIVDEFITFFIAGMDTTGHLIGMTLYNLTQYPQYLSQLKAEREVIYNQESQITTDTLSKMEVLHSVLKETLRFYTPAPLVFIRKAIEDHNLLDIKIRKGDLLSPAFLTPAFDEKYFENPEQFNPARWTNPESKLDPYAFVPFSAGPRNCIGQHLAIIEAKVIMSEFLNRFEFDLKEGYKLKMMMRFLYEPQDELLLNLRLKAQA